MRLSPGNVQVVATALDNEHPLFLEEPCKLTHLRQVAKIGDE